MNRIIFEFYLIIILTNISCNIVINENSLQRINGQSNTEDVVIIPKYFNPNNYFLLEQYDIVLGASVIYSNFSCADFLIFSKTRKDKYVRYSDLVNSIDKSNKMINCQDHITPVNFIEINNDLLVQNKIGEFIKIEFESKTIEVTENTMNTSGRVIPFTGGSYKNHIFTLTENRSNNDDHLLTINLNLLNITDLSIQSIKVAEIINYSDLSYMPKDIFFTKNHGDSVLVYIKSYGVFIVNLITKNVHKTENPIEILDNILDIDEYVKNYYDTDKIDCFSSNLFTEQVLDISNTRLIAIIRAPDRQPFILHSEFGNNHSKWDTLNFQEDLTYFIEGNHFIKAYKTDLKLYLEKFHLDSLCDRPNLMIPDSIAPNCNTFNVYMFNGF